MCVEPNHLGSQFGAYHIERHRQAVFPEKEQFIGCNRGSRRHAVTGTRGSPVLLCYSNRALPVGVHLAVSTGHRLSPSPRHTTIICIDQGLRAQQNIQKNRHMGLIGVRSIAASKPPLYHTHYDSNNNNGAILLQIKAAPPKCIV